MQDNNPLTKHYLEIDDDTQLQMRVLHNDKNSSKTELYIEIKNTTTDTTIGNGFVDFEEFVASVKQMEAELIGKFPASFTQ